MRLQQGDLIRTGRGLIASVIEDKGDGNVNCSYASCYHYPSLPMMSLKMSDIRVIKTGANQFWEEMFKEIKQEELREVIRQERELRAIQPTVKQKVIRRDRVIAELLEELGAEDMEELAALIKAKK